MRIDVLSLFPEMFAPVLSASIPGRAHAAGLVEFNLVNIRDYTENKHQKVDDRPFGGGPGMVMMCQPVWDAVLAAERLDPRPATRILLTPQGRPLSQDIVADLATRQRLLLIAGHYEGIDERVIEELRPMELSIGDYVLSGGELPALVLIDAIVRLLPGALGHEESAEQDSFAVSEGGQQLLDCPHYTRPREWRGREVPEILLSGDHGEVDRWRMEQRKTRTAERRPDLLKGNKDTAT
ncbi:MAG: tRNA (guanosine(37)-N1)-methyltransferase TrmD [Phycisphaerales bacterium]|nr:tRNA (guanosine(37)-N1)-methyltransferase TrmD [Phycisphaerales bacterium]